MADEVKVEVTANQTTVTNQLQTATFVSAPQGPPGPPGGAFIGGKEVIVNNLADKNLLSYNPTADAWVNITQETVTDGGNF